jgi:glycosyltransferase involved in cell wall biosynthesis
MKNKIITFIVDRYYPSIGGSQKLIKNLAEALSRRKYKINIITLRLKKTKKEELLNNVKIFRIRSSRLLFIFSFFFHALFNKKIKKILKESNCIHGFGILGPIPTYFSSRLYNKKKIITFYEILGDKAIKIFGTKGIWYKIYESIIFSFDYDYIIGISKSTSSLIKRKYNKTNVRLIYPFLEFKKNNKHKNNSNKNKIKFINYGRPGATKGIPYLIKAFDKFNKQNKKSELLLILSKFPFKERKKIEEIIYFTRNKNIHVRDSLNRKSLIREIENSDVVVVPSLSEGFGFTAAEGSFLGKPIIATKAGSLPELVIHNKTGILVNPFSSEELYNGMKKMKNKKFRIKLGLEGLKHIKKFNKKKTLQEYEEIYSKLI